MHVNSINLLPPFHFNSSNLTLFRIKHFRNTKLKTKFNLGSITYLKSNPNSDQMERGKDIAAEPASAAAAPSRYESQKRRDWNTFGQFLRNQQPPAALHRCNSNHVLEFLRYLDQFGKTKVHLQGCMFYGQPEPPAPCACPLRQAWGSLDALVGRLRAAYEESGGSPETNPFAGGDIRVYLREVKETQAKARGIPYKKKKKSGARKNDDESNSSTAPFS